jgi:3-methylcrotonyl-CoA carboxylase alpha subunit
VYSDADAHAKHVAACDEAVHIGGSAPKDSYLRWERIIEAAKATGAQAIHPGYGFLSENEDFARACADAGLVFIGPPAVGHQGHGPEGRVQALMERAGVPLVPGYHGANQDPRCCRREADRIGYPVLIKASAGGGGKGMRAVDKAEDFAGRAGELQARGHQQLWRRCGAGREVRAAPRHIEIQVFGDTHGNYVYLFERDCSVQRRHQKVLEEAPAPRHDARAARPDGRGRRGGGARRELRGRGHGGVHRRAARRLRRCSMKFYFMEMNTRLQVEHPVTEAITGLDLVEWQLRVAAGEPLPLAQDQLKIHGHAIEARICAENPDNNFLPATGTLQVYRLPECVTCRPSSAARMRRAAGRTCASIPACARAMRSARSTTRWWPSSSCTATPASRPWPGWTPRWPQTHIVGLATNVQFLRHVVGSRSFARPSWTRR